MIVYMYLEIQPRTHGGLAKIEILTLVSAEVTPYKLPFMLSYLYKV